MEDPRTFHIRRIAQIIATLEPGEKSHALDYHRRKLKEIETEEKYPTLIGYCPTRGVYIKPIHIKPEDTTS